MVDLAIGKSADAIAPTAPAKERPGPLWATRQCLAPNIKGHRPWRDPRSASSSGPHEMIARAESPGIDPAAVSEKALFMDRNYFHIFSEAGMEDTLV